MKVIFMGTPDFSVPVLDAIHKAHEIVAVYCQPPRPAGRGKADRPSPVQARAEALGLPVRHPVSLHSDGAAAEFAAGLAALCGEWQLAADGVRVPLIDDAGREPTPAPLLTLTETLFNNHCAFETVHSLCYSLLA